MFIFHFTCVGCLCVILIFNLQQKVNKAMSKMNQEPRKTCIFGGEAQPHHHHIRKRRTLTLTNTIQGQLPNHFKKHNDDSISQFQLRTISSMQQRPNKRMPLVDRNVYVKIPSRTCQSLSLLGWVTFLYMLHLGIFNEDFT